MRPPPNCGWRSKRHSTGPLRAPAERPWSRRVSLPATCTILEIVAIRQAVAPTNAPSWCLLSGDRSLDELCCSTRDDGGRGTSFNSETRRNGGEPRAISSRVATRPSADAAARSAASDRPTPRERTPRANGECGLCPRGVGRSPGPADGRAGIGRKGVHSRPLHDAAASDRSLTPSQADRSPLRARLPNPLTSVPPRL